MIARFCLAAAITLAHTSFSAAQPRTITPVCPAFESLAPEIVVLGPGEFLYGFREPSLWISPEAHPPLRKLRAFLESGTWPRQIRNRGAATATDNLLDVLKRNIRSDDPDLQAKPGKNQRYSQMCVFILQHADVLLRPGDAKALLDQETWEYPKETREFLVRLARWRQQLRAASSGL